MSHDLGTTGDAFDGAIAEMMSEAAQARDTAPLPGPPAHDRSAHQARTTQDGWDMDPMDTAATSFQADLAQWTGTEHRYRTAAGEPLNGVGRTLDNRDNAELAAEAVATPSALEVDWESDTVRVQLEDGSVENYDMTDAPEHVMERVQELAQHEGDAALERGQAIIEAAESQGLDVAEYLALVAEQYGEDVAEELADDLEQAGGMAAAYGAEHQHGQATQDSNEVLAGAYAELYSLSPHAAAIFKADVEANPPQSLEDVHAAYARAGASYASPIDATVDTIATDAQEDAQYQAEIAAAGFPDEEWVGELVHAFDGDVEAAAEWYEAQS